MHFTLMPLLPMNRQEFALTEKESVLRLMEIYITDQQHLNAFTLCSRLMRYDAQWTLQNLMDIYISTAILSGSTEYSSKF